MSENRILEDFEYDLESGRNVSWLSFSFRDLLISRQDFKKALFHQFKELAQYPKYHWFAEGRLSLGYLTEDEKQRWNDKHKPGVFYSDVESKLQDLLSEFNMLVSTNSVDIEFYGRNVLNTPMVKTLNQIGSIFKEFEKYVSRENKESYQEYASAFASQVIALTDKLNLRDLKISILNKFLDEAGNTDIMLSALMQNAYYNTDKLRGEYDILKLLANKLLRDELNKMKQAPIETLSLPADDIKLFQNTQMYPAGEDAAIEINQFNQMLIEDVRKYFVPLFSTLIGGQKLLTDKFQKDFFDSVFLGKLKLSDKLVFTTGATKRFVISIFHGYYNICKNNHEPSPNCSVKYRKILEENFSGYEKITNFRS